MTKLIHTVAKICLRIDRHLLTFGRWIARGKARRPRHVCSRTMRSRGAFAPHDDTGTPRGARRRRGIERHAREHHRGCPGLASSASRRARRRLERGIPRVLTGQLPARFFREEAGFFSRVALFFATKARRAVPDAHRCRARRARHQSGVDARDGEQEAREARL